jgi:hypothetical protein
MPGRKNEPFTPAALEKIAARLEARAQWLRDLGSAIKTDKKPSMKFDNSRGLEDAIDAVTKFVDAARLKVKNELSAEAKAKVGIRDE